LLGEYGQSHGENDCEQGSREFQVSGFQFHCWVLL
jgi:hypothetical protein